MSESVRRALGRLLALALCCAGGTAHAIPAPIPPEQLEADAKAIVEGMVTSATYLRTTTRGSYATAHYSGVLKIRRVIKGDLKPGATLPLRWGVEGWIGKGRQPPGRGKEPAFFVCEEIRVYLWSSKVKGKTVYHVSGRHQLRAPATLVAPTDKRRTLRCVRGKPR